ncbi:MAG: winged helix-turn-helix domain-containing protein [Saprospiraceae bacterium]|nr:winged helix-turn-helix domain-containing protein [Saprospiraceae bacterium]
MAKSGRATTKLCFPFEKQKERIVNFIYRSGLRKGIKIGLNERLIDQGMSHKEIAYLTDTSRQTVARIMNELKKENYIHYGSNKSSKILIRDMQVMQEYSWVVIKIRLVKVSFLRKIESPSQGFFFDKSTLCNKSVFEIISRIYLLHHY